MVRLANCQIKQRVAVNYRIAYNLEFFWAIHYKPNRFVIGITADIMEQVFPNIFVIPYPTSLAGLKKI
jgi:hypothetical protein